MTAEGFGGVEANDQGVIVQVLRDGHQGQHGADHEQPARVERQQFLLRPALVFPVLLLLALAFLLVFQMMLFLVVHPFCLV
jgi:hypothetical protein